MERKTTMTGTVIEDKFCVISEYDEKLSLVLLKNYFVIVTDNHARQET
jgi:hypothetical protein